MAAAVVKSVKLKWVKLRWVKLSVKLSVKLVNWKPWVKKRRKDKRKDKM